MLKKYKDNAIAVEHIVKIYVPYVRIKVLLVIVLFGLWCRKTANEWEKAELCMMPGEGGLVRRNHDLS